MMAPPASEAIPITSASDIVLVRQKVRQVSVQLKFGLVDQTKIVTAASELARNALEHGKGGNCRSRSSKTAYARGCGCVFEDHGPGIADIEQAMRGRLHHGRRPGFGIERKQTVGQRL